MDIPHFPPGLTIGIDTSEAILGKARRPASKFPSRMAHVRADAQALKFPDDSFDTVTTSYAMCSVPDPVRAFREFYRVLRRGGRLLMYEYVRSRNRILGLALEMMMLWTRGSGTEMNRDKLANARVTGFKIPNVESVYLDIILANHAVNRNSAGVATSNGFTRRGIAHRSVGLSTSAHAERSVNDGPSFRPACR